MTLLDLLERPIAFHRVLVAVTGSALDALFLSQCLYWSKRTNNPEGWFWKTADEWTEETGMSLCEQKTARRNLIKAGVLIEERRGVPCRMHFRLDKQRLEFSLRETLKLGCEKQSNQFAQNDQTGLPETRKLSHGTTAETTQRITTEEEVVAMWNSASNLRKVKALTGGRLKHLRSRLAEPYFRENWAAGIASITLSDFCTGKNDRGWVADFDFFIRPDTLAKVMEGKYDNRNGHSKVVPGLADIPSTHDYQRMRGEEVHGDNF